MSDSWRLGLMQKNDSVASSLGNQINKVGTGPGDLKKMLLGDDYFSDVNPKSMRRLMNVIHITGELSLFIVWTGGGHYFMF